MQGKSPRTDRPNGCTTARCADSDIVKHHSSVPPTALQSTKTNRTQEEAAAAAAAAATTNAPFVARCHVMPTTRHSHATLKKTMGWTTAGRSPLHEVDRRPGPVSGPVASWRPGIFGITRRNGDVNGTSQGGSKAHDSRSRYRPCLALNVSSLDKESLHSCTTSMPTPDVRIAHDTISSNWIGSLSTISLSHTFVCLAGQTFSPFSKRSRDAAHRRRREYGRPAVRAPDFDNGDKDDHGHDGADPASQPTGRI
jgi:hypothetical protein